ncbi:MAG TPA: hypothetical protein VI485_28035 [Vicinamibacterales bacterium]|nr:hypothetical protein [Vicinamibacterales bacterium]
MAEGDPGSPGQAALVTLSAEEQRALSNAIARVEGQLFGAVLKRLKTSLWIAAGAVAIFGAASVATVKSAIIDSAANQLAVDTRIRDEVVAQATQNLESINAVLRKAGEFDKKLDSEQQRALAVIEVDLDRVEKMIEQLRAELKQPRPGQ